MEGSIKNIKRDMKLADAYYNFPYSDFRKSQSYSIKEIITNKNSVLIAPTGYGYGKTITLNFIVGSHISFFFFFFIYIVIIQFKHTKNKFLLI